MILRKNPDPRPLKLKKGDLLGDTGGRGERMQSKLVMVLVLIFVGGLAGAQMAIPCESQINQILNLHGKPQLEKGDYEFRRGGVKYSYQGLRSRPPLFKNEKSVSALAELGREKERLEQSPEFKSDDLRLRAEARAKYYLLKTQQIECDTRKDCDDAKLDGIKRDMKVIQGSIQQSGKASSQVRVQYDTVVSKIEGLLRNNVFDLSIETKVVGDPDKEVVDRYIIERELSKSKADIARLELMPKSLTAEEQQSVQGQRKLGKWARDLKQAQDSKAGFEARLASKIPRAFEGTRISFLDDGEIQIYKYDKSWNGERMGSIDLATCKFKTPLGRNGQSLSSLYNCNEDPSSSEVELCKRAKQMEGEGASPSGTTTKPVD